MQFHELICPQQFPVSTTMSVSEYFGACKSPVLKLRIWGYSTVVSTGTSDHLLYTGKFENRYMLNDELGEGVAMPTSKYLGMNIQLLRIEMCIYT